MALKERRPHGSRRSAERSPDLLQPGSRELLARNGSAGGGTNGREPAMTIGLGAAREREEFVLDALGNGAARTIADFDAVDGTDRGDFGGGAAEENFVGDVEHFARDHGFGNWNAEVAANGDDGMAGDAGQGGIRERRGDDGAVHDEENIFARTFADVTIRIERDAFDVSVSCGFHANELRVHVVCGGFGHLRQRVGSGTIPRADADIHAIFQAVFTEILSPFPAGKIDLDWISRGIDAAAAVATQDNRAKIAGLHFVEADELEIRFAEFLYGEGNFHAVNISRIQETLHVFTIAENRGTLRGAVAADAFEDGGAVTDDVGENVDSRVFPLDKFAVVPDFFRLGETHRLAPLRRNAR